jgi:hypothetical protein
MPHSQDAGLGSVKGIAEQNCKHWASSKGPKSWRSAYSSLFIYPAQSVVEAHFFCILNSGFCLLSISKSFIIIHNRQDLGFFLSEASCGMGDTGIKIDTVSFLHDIFLSVIK